MGSGNVVHNLRLVEWENEYGNPAADRFDKAIKSAIEARDDEAVIDFHRYPDADYAVPTPDHFLPSSTSSAPPEASPPTSSIMSATSAPWH